MTNVDKTFMDSFNLGPGVGVQLNQCMYTTDTYFTSIPQNGVPIYGYNPKTRLDSNPNCPSLTFSYLKTYDEFLGYRANYWGEPNQ
jgi:hypothetical protein